MGSSSVTRTKRIPNFVPLEQWEFIGFSVRPREFDSPITQEVTEVKDQAKKKQGNPQSTSRKWEKAMKRNTHKKRRQEKF